MEKSGTITGRAAAKRRVTLRACAKLNLTLLVLGKRPDGYHELETLFEKIDLADEVAVALTDEPGIRLQTDAALPTDERNLAYRAAAAVLKQLPSPPGVAIQLTKRIPIGAGLGGGSSDAAAVLRALRELLPRPKLSSMRLQKIARELGADVPFFLVDANFAVGRGRGDVCERLPAAQRFWHVVATPPVALSTAEVYSRVRVPPITNYHGDWQWLTQRAWEVVEQDDAAALNNLCKNELLDVAQQLCPQIAALLEAVRQAGATAHLSGSGPTAFTVHATEDEAQRLATKLRSSGCEGHCVIAQTATPTS